LEKEGIEGISWGFHLRSLAD